MLEICDAYKIFQKGTLDERVALDHVSLSLKPGDFVTIIGSNGAGKSTLFNAITGSFSLDGGRILLADEDITWLSTHKRALMIGYLFQNPMRGTAPNMTIEENLALAYSRKKTWALGPGVSKKDAAFFREQLALYGMGLEDRMRAKVGLLSGGQRQALALLMSTVAGPRLLLLDEHTAALDPTSAEKIMQITVDIARSRKLTTLMITHNISQALRFGNRTLMLDRGKILLDIEGEERDKMTIPRLLEYFTAV